MLDAGYKVNVIPTEATAHVDGRFLPGYEDEFFATLAELCGEDVDLEAVSPPAAVGDAVRRWAGRRDDPVPARRGPGRPGRTVPDERRHRRQALPQARHAVVRLRPPPAARGPRFHRAVPRRSTSGCRWTRWSSARGCSTASSRRSDERIRCGLDHTWPRLRTFRPLWASHPMTADQLPLSRPLRRTGAMSLRRPAQVARTGALLGALLLAAPLGLVAGPPAQAARARASGPDLQRAAADG